MNAILGTEIGFDWIQNVKGGERVLAEKLVKSE